MAVPSSIVTVRAICSPGRASAKDKPVERAKAMDYLRKNAGDLVKNEVSMVFGKGQAALASACKKTLAAFSKQQGLDIIPDGRKCRVSGAQALEGGSIRTVVCLELDLTKSRLEILFLLVQQVLELFFRRHER